MGKEVVSEYEFVQAGEHKSHLLMNVSIYDKPSNKSTFLSSLNQNSCPVLDVKEIKKQEQKEAIDRLYP